MIEYTKRIGGGKKIINKVHNCFIYPQIHTYFCSGKVWMTIYDLDILNLNLFWWQQV